MESEKLNNEIHTEEYYIASIDLLGVKNIIYSDGMDHHLNSIRKIYKSWTQIFNDSYFKNIRIKFFSDNMVVAINADCPMAADRLLESIGWICSHLLKCGYKPRGGVCKGNFYIDDIFVWGSGLVDAYLFESKKAIYPRIVLSDDVVSAASKHLSDFQIYKDTDGEVCLNYLKAFGGNKDGWISDIEKMQSAFNQEFQNYNERAHDKVLSEEDKKIYDKLLWLMQFLEENLIFWKQY